MILHSDIEGFSANNPVVTVGIFDGVHRGHRFILEKLRAAARRLRGESTLVTLWPHPRTILNQVDDGFRLLNTMDEKIAILEDEGLQHLVVLPFTREFSRLSSCDFIRDYLVGKIGIRHLVVGYNHRFGRDREGDFNKLKDCAGEYGFGIEKVSALELDEGEVSSSMIRKHLQKGEVEQANQLLGWNYTLNGEVIGGSKLGSSIGFPTANITSDEAYKLIPADGVYAVLARLRGASYKGMLNIGRRPTINDDPEHKTIEVHLLDFEENIYSKKIQVQFIARLRDERKFGNIEALRKQLMIDRENTRKLFPGSGA